MSWITILLYVIRYLPAVIKIVKEIIDMIKKIDNKGEQKMAYKGLSMAVRDSKRDRDFRPLRDFHERLRQRCKR